MFKYALQIVFRRKLRTLLTSLGITIAVMLMTFILFGMTDLKTAILSEITTRFSPQDLYVSGKDNMSFGGMSTAPTKVENSKKEIVLTDEIFEKVQSIEGVASVQPLLFINGLDIYLEDDITPYPIKMIASSDLHGDHRVFKSFYGEDLVLDDGEMYVSDFVVSFFETTKEDIVGKTISAKSSSSGSFFSSASKSMINKEYSFVIKGVVETANDAFWVSNKTALDILTDLGGYENSAEYISNIGYFQLLVEAEEGKTEYVQKSIEDDLGLYVISSETILSFVDTITSGLTLALVLFGSISAVVASISIVNTMVMSIYEQTKEIGIIKAMGASNVQIMIIFLIQAGTIGFIGGVLGLVISYTSMQIADPFIVQLLNEQGFTVGEFFHFQIDNAIYITLGSILVGIMAGIYPAKRAASLDPVKALRYE